MKCGFQCHIVRPLFTFSDRLFLEGCQMDQSWFYNNPHQIKYMSRWNSSDTDQTNAKLQVITITCLAYVSKQSMDGCYSRFKSPSIFQNLNFMKSNNLFLKKNQCLCLDGRGSVNLFWLSLLTNCVSVLIIMLVTSWVSEFCGYVCNIVIVGITQRCQKSANAHRILQFNDLSYVIRSWPC